MSGSCAPRNSACVPAASSRSRYRSSTSAATLVAPQAMKRLRPSATAGVPGSVAPMTSKSPADDVREIPGRRQPRAEMRIVGEQRLAAGGQRAVDDPVVRAERFGRRAAEQEVARRRDRRRDSADANAADQRAAGRLASVRPAGSASSRWPVHPTVCRPVRPLARRRQDAQAVVGVRRHQLRHPLRRRPRAARSWRSSSNE